MIANATLTVTVEDVNECPRFLQEQYTGQLFYNEPFLTDSGDRLIIGVTDEDLVIKHLHSC